MDHFVIYVSCLYCFLSVHCSLVVACWEMADLLALLFVVFYFVFVTSPCGVLGQVWFVVVLIPDFLPSVLLCMGGTVVLVILTHFLVLKKTDRSWSTKWAVRCQCV